MLASNPYPLVIAHRGSSAHAPENTLAAFELAVAQGVHAIELDAKLSADGHVVVIHDPDVRRTTGKDGLVSQMPLAALRELDAGSGFGLRYQGEKIPTLEEVFACIGRQILINVELTNYTTPQDGLVDQVVELIRTMDRVENVLLSSFILENLIRARQRMPSVRTGYLAPFWRALPRLYASRHFAYDAFHPYRTDVNFWLVRHVHQRERKLFVYTVNRPNEMMHLADLGVDGFFTDDPVLAFQTLGVKT